MAFIKLLTKAAKKGVKSASKKDTAKILNQQKKTTSSVAASKGVKSMPKKYTMAFINKQPAGVKKELMKERKRFLEARAASSKTKKSSAMGSRFESVPKKSDKRIEGSGKFSARPPGSKGKASVKADSPRGGTTGISMKDARKKQMRDTANLTTGMKKLGRKYDDIPKGVRRAILMAIRSKDPAKIKKAIRGTGIEATQFMMVYKQRGKL